MNFEVLYTARARQDLRNIYEYIAYDLLVPETAARQAQRIMKEIGALNEMSMRYRLYDDEPWHSQGVRFFRGGQLSCVLSADEEPNTQSTLSVSFTAEGI